MGLKERDRSIFSLGIPHRSDKNGLAFGSIWMELAIF